MPHALDEMRYTREPADLLEQELVNHCVCHKTSFLAAKLLEEEYQLIICQSPAGFYLGSWDEKGPVSRDSQYFPSRKMAQDALDHRSWEQRMNP